MSPISFPMEMATLYPLYTSSHTNRVEYSVTNDVETRPQGRPIIDRLSLDRRYSPSNPTLLTLGSAGYPPTHINTIDSPLSRDLAACPFLFFFFFYRPTPHKSQDNDYLSASLISMCRVVLFDPIRRRNRKPDFAYHSRMK